MKKGILLPFCLVACEPKAPTFAIESNAYLASSVSAVLTSAAEAEAPEGPPPVAPLAHEDRRPPAPRYDLAADLEARKAAVRNDVGSKTKFEVVHEVFLLASPSAVGGSASLAKRALDAYFNDRFTQKPARAVTVLLFDTDGPYNAYCRAHWKEPCSTPYGFYTPVDRTVVMNAGPGIGTLTHELVHPIIETDFPEAPTWINEGIASLYEGFMLPKPGEIRGVKNWRHPRLLQAFASKKKERDHARLETLIGMCDQVFRGTFEDLHYAAARYFCLWLERQNKLWSFYRAWRDDFKNDPTGEKTFTAIMGKTPRELDAEWTSWARHI